MSKRIDELTAPPEVGRYYLVPTVDHPWSGRRKPWPVFLPRHEDAKRLNFPYWHYHIDPRFVSARDWSDAPVNRYESAAAAFQVKPLFYHSQAWDQVRHPEPVWRRLRCKREMPRYELSDAWPMQALPVVFAGQRCRAGKHGWVCPHKGIALGTVPAIDGIITCPGHGLRICEASGEVMP